MVAGLLAPVRADAQTGILPPDAAARVFESGRDAVRKGDYDAGIRFLNQALATGHTRPQERIGTTRNPAERYDPYYWLGVAYMETGDAARAQENLGRSRDAGLILRWPEGADLAARLERLSRDAKPRTEPPAPTPTERPTPPAPSPTATPVLGVALESPTPLPTEPPPVAASPATPPPLGDSAEELGAVASALARAEWDAAAEALRRFRAKNPAAPQGDLLEAVLGGTRYVLDGRRDEALRLRSRRALLAFRAKGGTKKMEETWVSPSLSALLAY